MDTQPQEVIVTDVKMRFWSMVVFMVKWAIASIPAIIIIAMILGIVSALFHGCATRWTPGNFRM